MGGINIIIFPSGGVSLVEFLHLPAFCRNLARLSLAGCFLAASAFVSPMRINFLHSSELVNSFLFMLSFFASECIQVSRIEAVFLFCGCVEGNLSAGGNFSRGAPCFQLDMDWGGRNF